jgi:hemerythrin
VEDRIRISFDPTLETGNAEIDSQHRDLFDRIDKLLSASRDRRSRGEVGQMLTFLGQYVVQHFAAEDRLMSISGYPDADVHRAEHARFVEEYGKLFREFKSEGPTSLFVIRVGNRVTAWLRDHIYRTDRELVDWINQQKGH